MKPQETAQERAETYVHKKYGLGSDLSEQVQSDFMAGERITLERLAAKASEGFDDFRKSIGEEILQCNQTASRRILDYDLMKREEAAWQERGIPLLAKIELLEKRIRELEEKK